MSLVGPRPLPVRDYEGFNEDWQRRRFSIPARDHLSLAGQWEEFNFVREVDATGSAVYRSVVFMA